MLDLARTALGGLVLALPLAATASGQAAPEPPDGELPEVVVTRPKPAYRSHGDALALLDKWAAARPEASESVELGETPGGRALRGLLVGRPAAVGARGEAGEGAVALPLAERRVVLLVGGIDGRSLHGSEAVLAITAELLADPGALPPDLAFLCLPWAAPDGLDAELARLAGVGPGTGGKNARPRDEDLDGLVDEDGADDLDGDGLATTMLVPDPEGPWRRATDARFLVAWDSEGAEGPRYRLLPEGRDEDGDGDLNEDGPGGVRVDRNFPLGWRGPNAPFAPGPWPLSEPESAGLARVIDDHDVLAAFLFDGHSGAVEYHALWQYMDTDHAGEPTLRTRRSDAAVRPRLEPLAQLALGSFAAATPEGGGDLFAQRPVLGSPLEYLDSCGVPALRLATWGPGIGLGRGSSVSSAAFRREQAPEPSGLELEDFCEPTSLAIGHGRGTAWRRYLDERRGGIGFVDWHPVELEGVGTVLVGGWEAASIVNPPEEQLGLSVDLGLAVHEAFLAALPRFELAVGEALREGGLVSLSASAEQLGGLPPGFLGIAELELALELPASARLVAGSPRVTWPADEPAPGPEWLVHADEPGALRLVLRSKGVGDEPDVVLAMREVRP